MADRPALRSPQTQALPRWRRRRPRLVVLCAAMAIAVELVTASSGLVLNRTRPRAAAPPSSADSRSIQHRGLSEILRGGSGAPALLNRMQRVEAVRALLAARANAVLRRDRAAYLATVDPSAVGLRDRQARQFDGLLGVPLASWGYEVDADPRRDTPLPPGLTPVYGDELWAPAVRLRFALAGFDTEPTEQEQRYFFVRQGERWYLADDGPTPALAPGGGGVAPGGGTVRNLWDFGPVTSLHGERSLILGHPGDEPLMRRIHHDVERAIPRIAEVWPDWSQRVVVLVPHSSAELAHLVEDAGDLSQIAAFASADTPRVGQPTGKRVVVNPGVFGDLTPTGRRIVLTHEITHVAARAVTGPVTPIWLAEGLADYVAYRTERAEDRSVAKELADDIRRGELPARLPQQADFGSENKRLSQAYQQAWLACRLIVERAGEEALVRIYRRVSLATGDPAVELDAALRNEVTMGTDQFVATWRAYLKEKLG